METSDWWGKKGEINPLVLITVLVQRGLKKKVCFFLDSGLHIDGNTNEKKKKKTMANYSS